MLSQAPEQFDCGIFVDVRIWPLEIKMTNASVSSMEGANALV